MHEWIREFPSVVIVCDRDGVVLEQNAKADSGAGGEFAMHLSTTPVIEIAGDGKTAKGIWYSPGLGLSPKMNDSSVDVTGIFFWERYGGDFIKEKGVWKIWHLGMYYDFTPQLPTSMTSNLAVKGSGQAQAPAAAPTPQVRHAQVVGMRIPFVE